VGYTFRKKCGTFRKDPYPKTQISNSKIQISKELDEKILEFGTWNLGLEI